MGRTRRGFLLHPHRLPPSIQRTTHPSIPGGLCGVAGGRHPAGHAESILRQQQDHGGGCGGRALAGGAASFHTVTTTQLTHTFTARTQLTHTVTTTQLTHTFTARTLQSPEWRQVRRGLLAVADYGGGAGVRL